jgi:plasmid stabilization system protein ParE
MAPLKIIWTNNAKDELKAIFEYYKVKSLQGAHNVKNDILKASREIHFVEQYQRDEIEPEYRRIIVRDFKFLYKEEKEGTVFIAGIFSTKQYPSKQLE